jgi:hypothetical protein
LIRLLELSYMLRNSLINKFFNSLIIIIIKFFSLNQLSFFHLLSDEISIIELISFLFSIFFKIRSIRNSFLLALKLFLFLYIFIIVILESRNHIVHVEPFFLLLLNIYIKYLVFHVSYLISDRIKKQTYLVPRTYFVVAFSINFKTLSVLHWFNSFFQFFLSYFHRCRFLIWIFETVFLLIYLSENYIFYYLIKLFFFVRIIILNYVLYHFFSYVNVFFVLQINWRVKLFEVNHFDKIF